MHSYVIICQLFLWLLRNSKSKGPHSVQFFHLMHSCRSEVAVTYCTVLTLLTAQIWISRNIIKIVKTWSSRLVQCLKKQSDKNGHKKGVDLGLPLCYTQALRHTGINGFSCGGAHATLSSWRDKAPAVSHLQQRNKIAKSWPQKEQCKNERSCSFICLSWIF